MFNLIAFFRILLQVILIIIQRTIAFFCPFAFLPKKDIKNKIVLITGSGSGLGRHIAIQLAHYKCKLVLWDINEDGNKETQKLCVEAGSKCFSYVIDLVSRENIYKTAKKVRENVGKVDILINNAGILCDKLFLDIPDEKIEQVMRVNVFSHFWLLKAFLPQMIKCNDGHIVSICSLAGLFGSAGLVEYSTSKFAAVGLLESVRHELLRCQRLGVKTTIVCPHFFRSKMTEKMSKLSCSSSPNEMMDVKSVAHRTVEAILTNSPIIIIPKKANILYFAKGILSMEFYSKIVLLNQ